MTCECADKLTSIRVPYFACSIVAGCGKVLSILAKTAISERLFMSLQMQIFFIMPFLWCIGFTYFYLDQILLATAFLSLSECSLSKVGC